MSKTDLNSQIDKIRVHYFKARVYRMAAISLGVVGIIISAVLHGQVSGGDVKTFIEKPFTILILLTPLIPALVLGIIAKSKYKKYVQLVESSKTDLSSQS